FVVRTVYKVADGILAHEPRVIRLEQVGNLGWIGDTRIKPSVIIFWTQDHGHSVVNVSDEGVRLSSENGARLHWISLRILPALPQSGEGEQLIVRQADVVSLL